MANELTIDLTDPAMQEAFAECNPGETHTVTMDITVTDKGETLVADLDPETVDKYAGEEEAYEEEEAITPVGEAAPPEAVALVMKGTDAEEEI